MKVSFTIKGMRRFSDFKILLILSAIVLLIVGLTGCSANQVVFNQKVPPVHYSTYASLSPDATQLGPFIGLKLIGRTAADTSNVENLSVPVVANLKPDYELLAKLKPDLIVYDPSIYNASDIEKIKQLGIPTFAITGNTVKQYIKTLYKLGSMTQSESQINGMVDHIYSQMDAAEGDPITQPHNTALIMPVPNSNPMIADTGSFYADLIRVSGGTPVGSDGHKFSTIDPESLLALNPDCIVIVGKPADAAAFMKDPRFAALKALKEGHIFSVHASYVLQRGANVFEAIKAIHRALGQVLRSGSTSK